MRLGYPCSNLSLGAIASRTFRLASFSEERLIETVQHNLSALHTILRWNIDHEIAFFRISSATIPFGSHPVMTVDWQSRFSDELAGIGATIRKAGMRINVHPGQYTLINSPKPDVVARSIAELQYHAELMDLMNLDATHKIQIHTGGVYGDKPAAIDAFVHTYSSLSESIRRRLVIENDERQFSLSDNLVIRERTGVPLLFDIFHHKIFNNGESLTNALGLAIGTWEGHGPPMIDYSSQNPEKQAGAHTASIDLDDFAESAMLLMDRDVDLMLEIKDKEASVLKARAFLATLQAAALT